MEKYLENMAPVFPLVIQSLVQHFHDLNEVVPVRADKYKTSNIIFI